MKELENKIKIRYCDKKYLQIIDKTIINTVFECGSRDALDAIRIDMVYEPEEIYIFEPNPEGIIQCRDNLSKYNKNHLKFFDLAVSDIDGKVDFYPTTEENIGAASMLKYNSRANGWDGYKHNNFKATQKQKIQVNSTRLDTFIDQNRIASIDLLCMDVQEAELLALKGLGEHIDNVKYIILEVTGEGYYVSGARFSEVDAFLKGKNFKLADIDKTAIPRFGNAIYISNTIGENF